MVMVILMFALFATVFPLGKVSMLYCSPIFLTGVRMLIAGIILLIYYAYSSTERIGLIRAYWWDIFLLSLFNIYLTSVCEFWGLQYLSAGKACFIYNLSPFVSALISYFVFKEIMTAKKWLGLLMGFAGFLPILISSDTTEHAIGGIGFLSWAELSLMVAATATVFGWISMRKAVHDGMHVLYANGWSMFFGGIAAIITSYFTEVWNPLPFNDFSMFLWYTIIMMLVANIFCYNAYGYLLKVYTATFLIFAGFTCPLWAAFYGWLFLAEPIKISFLASCIAVLSGLYIFYSEELKLGYVRKK